jgi:hypothetical protein
MKLRLPERGVPHGVLLHDGRLAAVVVTGGRWQVLSHDYVSAEYDACDNLVANPISHALVYSVWSGDKARLVIDGKPQDPVDSITTAVFSATGALAWAWRTGNSFFVREGSVMYGPYAGLAGPVYRPGTNELAFAFRDEGGAGLRQGEKVIRISWAVDIPRLCYDSTGRKLAAVCTDEGGKAHFVVNGADLAVYDAISNVVWSADGDSYAYEAERARKSYVVHDGKEFGPYVRIRRLRFARASRSLVFAAEEQSGYVLFANGALLVKTKAWIRDCAISDDGETIAHIEVAGAVPDSPQWSGEYTVVLNGRFGRRYGPYAGASLPVLSPKGATVAFAAVVRDGEEFRVRLAVNGNLSDPLHLYGEPSFPEEGIVQYIVQTGNDRIGRGGELAVMRACVPK